ncbi:MAG: serine/threonine protein phosphatase, partial [Actinomycetota bacterium]
MLKYAVSLGALGLGQIYLGLDHGWLGAPVLWSGVSFLAVAAGYAGLGPRVFGKRPDGRLSLPNRLLLLPYLCFSGAVWHLKRVTSSRPGWHEVAPGIRLGRRPQSGELPDDVTLLVDLTAEFPGLRRRPNGCDYLSLPSLDATAPDPKQFDELVSKVAAA